MDWGKCCHCKKDMNLPSSVYGCEICQNKNICNRCEVRMFTLMRDPIGNKVHHYCIGCAIKKLRSLDHPVPEEDNLIYEIRASIDELTEKIKNIKFLINKA